MEKVSNTERGVDVRDGRHCSQISMLGTWAPISFCNTFRQHYMETLPVLFLVIGLVDKDPCRLKDSISKCWRRRDVDPAVVSVPHQHPLLQKPGNKGDEDKVMFLGTCSNEKLGAPLVASFPHLGPSYHGLHACPRKMTCLNWTVSHPIFGRTSRAQSGNPVECVLTTFSSPSLRLCVWKQPF